jgi:hypothetical protein
MTLFVLCNCRVNIFAPYFAIYEQQMYAYLAWQKQPELAF